MEDNHCFSPSTSASTVMFQSYLQHDPSHIFKDDSLLYEAATSLEAATLTNNREELLDSNVNWSTSTTTNNDNNKIDSTTILSEKMKREPSYIFSPDKEFDFLLKTPRKKSTSLRIRKPEEKDSEKKVVRFSDALGLELTSTRHVFDADEPPIVPESATKDLKLNFNDQFIKSKEVKKLCICFSSPENCLDFIWRVQEKKVLLENCSVNDSDNSVHGSIRVENLAFDKKVIIRYTFDNWLSHQDLTASFESSVSDGATDRFQFAIYLPDSFESGNFLQFSIKYSSNNHIFWDNNFGSNYRVECYMGNKFY